VVTFVAASGSFVNVCILVKPSQAELKGWEEQLVLQCLPSSHPADIEITFEK
jgi:hypothetical protein